MQYKIRAFYRRQDRMDALEKRVEALEKNSVTF